jgi:hypothetical protein
MKKVRGYRCKISSGKGKWKKLVKILLKFILYGIHAG